MTEQDEETQQERPSMGPGAEELPLYVKEIVAGEGDVAEFAEYVNRPVPALLVVLTGPSGVGKDVTLQRMRELGLNFHYVVTVTTREQRPGEIDGIHYFFKTRREYEQMKVNGELLEDAEVYGNYYGIPRSQVVDPLRKGIDVIMKPDVQGARTMREKEPDAIYIFLAPPSMEDLASRLYHRKTEDPQELAKRLEVAREEMHAISDFDYVVVNRNNELDETVEEIEAIIEAEKSRVHPRRIRLAEDK
jgi:guanylate kinase